MHSRLAKTLLTASAVVALAAPAAAQAERGADNPVGHVRHGVHHTSSQEPSATHRHRHPSPPPPPQPRLGRPRDRPQPRPRHGRRPEPHLSPSPSPFPPGGYGPARHGWRPGLPHSRAAVRNAAPGSCTRSRLPCDSQLRSARPCSFQRELLPTVPPWKLRPHPSRRPRPPWPDAAPAPPVRRAPRRADPTRQPGGLRGARRALPVAPAGLLPPHARLARGRRGRPAGGLRRRLQRDDRRRPADQRAPVALPDRAQPLA